MLSMRLGDRALPLIWLVAAGVANLGFDAPSALLEVVVGWLPTLASVLLAARSVRGGSRVASRFPLASGMKPVTEHPGSLP